jgi:hypothetical protein
LAGGILELRIRNLEVKRRTVIPGFSPAPKFWLPALGFGMLKSLWLSQTKKFSFFLVQFLTGLAFFKVSVPM